MPAIPPVSETFLTGNTKVDFTPPINVFLWALARIIWPFFQPFREETCLWSVVGSTWTPSAGAWPYWHVAICSWYYHFQSESAHWFNSLRCYSPRLESQQLRSCVQIIGSVPLFWIAMMCLLGMTSLFEVNIFVLQWCAEFDVSFERLNAE